MSTATARITLRPPATVSGTGRRGPRERLSSETLIELVRSAQAGERRAWDA